MKRFVINCSFSYIFTYIFNIYIFLLIFDPLREAIDFGVISPILSALRDMVIILCFFMVVVGKRNKVHSYYILIFCFCCFVLAILSFFEPIFRSTALRSTWGVLRGLMVFFVIINLSDLYVGGNSKLLVRYIIMVLCCFFLSIYIYFFHANILVAKYFETRIGVGNPSIQSIIYVSSFALCLYYKPFKPLLNFFSSLILLIATLSTVTATAFVAIFIILLFTIGNRKFRKQWLLIISIATITIILVILYSGIDFSFLFKYLELKFNETVQLFEKYLSGNFGEKTESISFRAREKQIENFKDQLITTHIPLGDGKFASVLNDKNFIIENTYYALFRDFGLLGLLNYLIFLCYNLIYGIIIFIKKKQTGIIVAVLIIAAYSSTLYVFAGTSLMVQLYIFLYLMTAINNERLKNDKKN